VVVAPGRRGSEELPLLRGVLFTLRRRCGKVSCRCATGDPHETPALAYPQGGRTRTLTLSESDVDAVVAALARYTAAKERLDARADAEVASLRARRGRGGSPS
jgi:Family of unknown function (DUF6788)